MRATVSGVVEDPKFKISEGSHRLAERANWAGSGKHQFWSKPFEISNLRSSATPETLAITPP